MPPDPERKSAAQTVTRASAAADPTTREAAADVSLYDPAVDDYDLSKDPRCLWGWGGCGHRFGHACLRPYRHPGRCWDAGDKPERGAEKCSTSARPRSWDDRGRAEANA